MHRKSRLIPTAILIFAAAFTLSAGAEMSEDELKTMRSPDVVFVGTPYDLVSKMLQMAQVKKNDRIYDLGCGDARILVLAALKYGSRGTGYEIDPDMVRASRANIKKNKVENLVKIIQADIFTVDLSKADVLPLYLLPEMNRKLLAQFAKLKPGSRIVCHNYDLEGIVPDNTIHVVSNEDNADHTLYLYTTPLKRQ